MSPVADKSETEEGITPSGTDGVESGAGGGRAGGKGGRADGGLKAALVALVRLQILS